MNQPTMAGRNSVNPQFVSYKECRRNHALTSGADIVDGCREFAASGEGSMALICQACGCHRSFHRREVAIPQAFQPQPQHQLLPMGTIQAGAPFVVLHRPLLSANRHIILPATAPAPPQPRPVMSDARAIARAEIEGEIDFEPQRPSVQVKKTRW